MESSGRRRILFGENFVRSIATRVAVLAIIGAFIAAPTRAQDLGQFAATMATAAEGFGQGVGDAANAGPSVYVTATGRVKLPAPLTDAYLMNLEGKSKSAVAAAAIRDRQLETARAIATTFGVDMQVGASTFSRQVDQEAQQAAQQAAFEAAQAAQTTATGRRPARSVAAGLSGPEPMVFVAVTGVRFQATDPKRLPAFLDALQSAGIADKQSGTIGVGMPNFLFGAATQVLGFGRLATVDDAIWDEASAAAVAAARRQATILATAAGRKLGEARQVLLLSKSAQGDEAAVTVAIRFGYLPG